MFVVHSTPFSNHGVISGQVVAGVKVDTRLVAPDLQHPARLWVLHSSRKCQLLGSLGLVDAKVHVESKVSRGFQRSDNISQVGCTTFNRLNVNYVVTFRYLIFSSRKTSATLRSYWVPATDLISPVGVTGVGPSPLFNGYDTGV